jgi:hypothetical protein
MAQQIAADDVSFNPNVIAAAWESFEDGIPAVCAAAIVNDLPNGITVTANDGEEADRDVHFADAGVMVEEKAMGVCPRDVAEEHAPAYVELGREDRYVLALNGAQVFKNHTIPTA